MFFLKTGTEHGLASLKEDDASIEGTDRDQNRYKDRFAIL